MTLTIVKENGTGVAGANAYETVAETKTRLDDLQLTLFGTLTAAQQAAALYRGTASVENRIRPHLTGRKTIDAQGLSYPRELCYYRGVVILSTEIPVDLLMACAYETAAEAVRINAGDATRGARGIKRRSAPGGTSVEYVTAAGEDMAASLVDDMAAPHIRSLISRRAA